MILLLTRCRTLYRTHLKEWLWPSLDSADPLAGWPLDEVMEKISSAKNDIYGALYSYLKDLLTQFCKKIADISFSVQLFHLDAVELPGVLKEYGIREDSCDRIEVSRPPALRWKPNIIDKIHHYRCHETWSKF
jgi:hypothetical protein